MVEKTATAKWNGSLTEGNGSITTDTGVLSNSAVSWASSTNESKQQTSPEELIAAAHAGCFSMALSGQLGNAGLTAESIRTAATVTMDKTDAGFTITAVHLDVTARIPGAEQQAFDAAAEKAKAGCPVSRVLNATITMQAKLES